MGILDAFGGAGASVEDITAGRSTVAGESIDHGEDQRQAIAETAAAITAQQQQDAQRFTQAEPASMPQALALQDAVNQLQERQRQAKEGLGFPMPLVLSALGDYSLRMQANKLAKGGRPVFDDKGVYRGVISQGPFGEVYSGQPEYNPFFQPDYQDDGDEPAQSFPTLLSDEESREDDASMIPQGYVYPDGGFFPREGRFLRMGLLDRPIDGYGGLLAGQDPSEFEAMNMAFRQPTYAGIYQDPYDLTGYTLLDE